MTTAKIAALALTALTVGAAPVVAAPKERPATAKEVAPKKKGAPLPAAVRDCAPDGDLDRVYSPGHLKLALRKVPTDAATYTYCEDVLRFARTAGPSLPVTGKRKGTARFRARCTGEAYEVTVSSAGKLLGTATVPACRSGRTKVVRIPVGATGARKARGRKAGLVQVVAAPGGIELKFVQKLVGRRA